MFNLRSSHRDVRATSGRNFCDRRASVDAVGASVVAHAAGGMLVSKRCVIDVTNDRRVNVGDAGVIEIIAAAPVSTVKTGSRIAKTVVNAAVKTYSGAPITRVPEIKAVVEGPVAGSPEQADSRRPDPHSWNPKITLISVGPITGHPNVTTSGTNRLGVNRQRRGTNTNRNCDVNSSRIRTCGRDGRCP